MNTEQSDIREVAVRTLTRAFGAADSLQGSLEQSLGEIGTDLTDTADRYKAEKQLKDIVDAVSHLKSALTLLEGLE